jgi:ATP-dependent Clp protease ATP-binding subunit ClpA
MGHPWIGTEHLLIAITRQRDTVAYNALMQLGLNTEQVQEKTQQILKEMARTTDGKPVAELNQIPDEVWERFHLRVVTNEIGKSPRHIRIPLK